MKYLSLILSSIFVISCSTSINPNKHSRVIILGTIHYGAENINTESVYTILSKFKPDIILLEAESNIFEKENVLKTDFDGINNNEFQATLKYQKENPGVQIKPAELEGRNNYRKELGIYSEAGFVFNKLEELDKKGEIKLSDQEKKNLSKLNSYWNAVESIAKQDLKTVNSKQSDAIVDSLMKYQYNRTRDIVNNHNEFTKFRLLSSKNKKDTITFKEYFNNWSNFEGNIRNEGIAKNVIKYYKENPGKKIILLTGFKHRFFIKKYLESQNIKTIEFYQ
ncbi:hypothetical protein OZ664_11065 [Elizabethkingia sp. HX WHF]|uniref:TraB/GumN family protein n=1 Tax=Elizabethkingia bruuniana TaxID=1756149 RepID=A0A7T7UWD6_9FLAO|nr:MULTISPECIES: hypothetical protein [Elizabethkingia]ATL43480.1 hypothetical protein CQS02_09295 [Elizabethkingia miricola]AQX83956.1 hypothetical protein AYC65_02495 [Elizabethkingia bruuniana]KGO08613.1 hypothetical protein KS04_18780 [Elizabethkingia miricola]KUY28207.1 hypothetical protein ATB97_14880 [Elizabethkingia bruuniana]MCL1638430.1 hypothetical protein [Elizabethkingia bruuniana]